MVKVPELVVLAIVVISTDGSPTVLITFSNVQYIVIVLIMADSIPGYLPLLVVLIRTVLIQYQLISCSKTDVFTNNNILF